MPLSAGTRLGPYEIVSLIGEGGMGEVYRARDPRMGREVAIKISAERFSDRFEREVRAVAALNHPNICQIYDVGSNYLVMEVVEGPTLADRIKEGALPLEEALAIARQMGDALEAAHEKGIIHRDLKPANIKITPDGMVKVLDFGLAKMAEAAPPVGSPDESPTVPMGATRVGQIMGTAAYMAPEQARGKAVDKRADIWAFGVVLYEVLTGRRLFEGETISDTLAGVLTKEPDWSRVPAKTRRLLQSCLEKDPKRRLRDIGDAWRLLEETPAPAASSRLPWIAAAAMTLVSVIALWAPWRGTAPSIEHASVGLDLDLGADVSLGTTVGPAVILSPDGTRLVFVSRGQDGTPRLFTRVLNQPKATMLAKTEGAYAPFFSPDGQWVGFFAGGKLKKIRIDGGEPFFLCDAPAGRGASWGEDGRIVAALDSLTFLSLVPAEGGRPTPLTELAPEESTHRWPQVLPSGKAVLFLACTNYGGSLDPSGIAVLSLKDGHKRIVLEHAGMYPRYLASGHLVYATKGSLFGIAFDAERLEVRGVPAMLGEASSNPILASAQYDVSRDGTLGYVIGMTEKPRTIQWLDGTGRTESLVTEPALYAYPRLAPAGGRLAVIESQGVGGDLFVHDLERGGKTRLTNQMSPAFPLWSPDGQFLIFRATGGMFWTRSDGAGQVQPLTQSKRRQMPTSFTPDGGRLVFAEANPAGGAEIRVVPVENASGQLRVGEPQSLLKTATTEVYASFSPDGRWLAYADAEGGSFEVYVRAFPDNGTRVQVSNAGGMVPVWSRNRHELYYRTEEQRIMVVNYSAKGDSFVPEKPRMWSGKQLANLGTGRNYDLAPDGQRFVVVMPVESAEPRVAQSHVTLVVNFFDEVRRRVGGQGK